MPVYIYDPIKPFDSDSDSKTKYDIRKDMKNKFEKYSNLSKK